MEADLRPRMSAVALGGWIGFLDTVVLSIALSGHSNERFGQTLKLLLVAILPGMLIGFTLGAVVGDLTALRVAARRAIAIGPPVIVAGGIFLLQPSHPWFLLVLVPMIACSLYLEHRTRRTELEPGLMAPPLRGASAAALGTVIGTCNTVFVAVGLAFQLGRDAGIVLFLAGIVPALIIGNVLGAIGARLAHERVWVRRVVLVLLPVGLLMLLTAPLGVTAMFAPASIPTAVCGLVLERATRQIAELPIARARVTSDPAGPSPRG
ncbi:MAG: hypothetical protein ABJE66_29975 [Deltaproteobacteria bacterium]